MWVEEEEGEYVYVVTWQIALLCYAVHRVKQRLLLSIQVTLIPPACLMQGKRSSGKHKQCTQVRQRESLGLENGLKERHVDERKLDNKGDAHCDHQHAILPKSAAQSTILHCRNEIKENKSRKRLRRTNQLKVLVIQ